MRAGKGFAALVIATTAVWAAPAHAGLSFAPAFSGSVSQPIYVTAPPGDSQRLFVVTRPGVIRVAVDGVLQSTPFLNISSGVSQAGEGGLLSMAFDPGYGNPASPGYGLFYVYYVETPDLGSSNGDIEIKEFHTDPATSPNVANPTGRLVLEIPHDDASNHYGGTLQFSPLDQLLYIGTGDGGGSDNQYGNAQDTKKSLLGKLLRIDPRQAGSDPYSIPAGNLFAAQPRCNPPSGTTDCPEILAKGLRNPFRWSFDRTNGDIAIGDVGQGQREEIDYVPASGGLAGDNFGWPCREGELAYHTSDAGCSGATLTDPVDEYGHSGGRFAISGGGVAITGGVVVRDPALTPLFGRYLYADYYQKAIRSQLLATPSSTDDRAEALPDVANIAAFGQDADGHVYIVSLAGSVQRIVYTPEPNGGGDTPPGTTPQQPPSDQTPPGDQSAVPATPSARDTTAPRLTVRAAKRQDVLRRGRLRLAVTCDESCIVRVSGIARGLRLRGALQRIAAGRPAVFELRVSARARRALARRGVVTLSVRARDAAGNLRTTSLAVRVKR